ncbi:hypothetical protein D3C86_2078270 [compost metagenome]
MAGNDPGKFCQPICFGNQYFELFCCTFILKLQVGLFSQSDINSIEQFNVIKGFGKVIICAHLHSFAQVVVLSFGC